MLKSLRLALASAVVIALSLSAAPASATGSAEGKVPAWLTISSQGGFVAPDYIKTQLPDLVVYSDGVVLRNDVSSIRSDVRNMSRRTLSTSWLKQQIRAIAKLTRTPKGGWGTPGVADVPDTRIRINLGSTQVNIGVYALNFTNGNLTTAQVAARKALSKAVTTFRKTIAKQRATVLKPTVYEVWVNEAIIDVGGVSIANPAAVFCTSMGGVETNESTPAGETGYCNFGTLKFDEWDYYRTESAKLTAWPTSAPVLTTGCNVVPASAVSSALKFANEAGRWLFTSGQAFSPVLRPVLMGETACAR